MRLHHADPVVAKHHARQERRRDEAPHTNEAETQERIVQALEVLGIVVYDTSQPFRAAITPGLPDLICFCPDRGLFFVEVKKPVGRQTKAQKAFQRYAEAAGIPYVCGGDAVTEFLSDAGGGRTSVA